MFDNLSNDRLQPRYAIDGDETTRYTTGAFAKGNEWFEVDLCRAVQIDEVKTFTDAATDVAASYNVQVSTDGMSWSTVLTSSSPAAQRQSLTFTPVLARYVRYNQTGTSAGWWSLAEFSVVCSP